MLQRLWLSKIGWDDAVPDDVTVAWNRYIKTLHCLSELRIPRFVRSMHTQHTELHIFTDASEDAYGACAYVRTYDDCDSDVEVNLLCAKSKVAPLKTISIPRLELCGALLGAKLYKKIINSLRLKFDNVYFWTDSTVVMGWIRMSPHLLKTFVQNRVTELNELTGDSRWLHIKSKDNPADLVSRGLNFELLTRSNLWWHGPSCLREHNFKFKPENVLQTCDNLPELRSKPIVLTCTEPCNNGFIDFNRFSSYNKLKRVTAYVLRFINNTRRRRSGGELHTGCLHLSVQELKTSELTLARVAQLQSFPDVYHCLFNDLPLKQVIDKRQINKIASLNVFMDNNKLIRVGGRLSNSTFSFDKKHPILLCSKHRLTVLLFESEHKRLLHGGPQLLLSSLRERWWTLGARNLARKSVHNCVTCTRMKGKTLNPIMGNLPSERLEVGFPFIRCGVDYAGPVHLLNRKGRGARIIKGYICLFVCFITRAIHLELVSGLSTQDYILALKRFISRRGKPAEIFSDNGKNFVGAEKEFLHELNKNVNKISDFASDIGISFRFIPPYAPHFGGLWEAGIKSCKFHLKRVIGNANLTYEELSTVLIQIEAVLNSRPLTPMSSDPNDFSPLTPAHFLIGRPLIAPASNLTARNTSYLNRYERVEQMREHFWKRWAKEFVSELQLRTKWKHKAEDISVDTLVLIKEDNLPPLKWRLGRILRTFPGKDGVARVADIRTSTGIVQRAFSKICPLPLQPVDEGTTKEATSC